MICKQHGTVVKRLMVGNAWTTELHLVLPMLAKIGNHEQECADTYGQVENRLHVCKRMQNKTLALGKAQLHILSMLIQQPECVISHITHTVPASCSCLQARLHMSSVRLTISAETCTSNNNNQRTTLNLANLCISLLRVD